MYKTENPKLELRKYKSVRVVGAMKIKSVIREMNNSANIKLEKGKSFFVPAWLMLEKKPQTGQYFVEYEDGYIGFQDAKIFEAGYVKVKTPAKKAPPEKKVTPPKTGQVNPDKAKK